MTGKFQKQKIQSGVKLFNAIYEEHPETLRSEIEEMLREAFAQHGGNPDALHVSLGPNDRVPRDDGTVTGYKVKLALHFKNDAALYEVPHDKAVTDFSFTFKQAFSDAGGSHKPGYYEPPFKNATGDYHAALEHVDVGHLAGVLHKFSDRHGLISVDTRLMGVGHDASRLGTLSR